MEEESGGRFYQPRRLRFQASRLKQVSSIPQYAIGWYVPSPCSSWLTFVLHRNCISVQIHDRRALLYDILNHMPQLRNALPLITAYLHLRQINPVHDSVSIAILQPLPSSVSGPISWEARTGPEPHNLPKPSMHSRKCILTRIRIDNCLCRH